ncbi:MAG: hypothetical protein HQ555_07235 [Candidatus Aminicenantes bacterium]|nr:hypothetical protein [Candidatus Aminicenantes bacterium]
MANTIIQDAIIFKNGDFINGQVLNKIFNIKTSYGQIAIKQKEVAHIHMRGTQFTRDEIMTLERNKFTGILQEKIIAVKLQSGQELKIEKNKILTLMMLTNRGF